MFYGFQSETKTYYYWMESYYYFDIHILPGTGVAGMWNQGKYKFSVDCVHFVFHWGHGNVCFTAEILLVKICLLNIIM